jgi:hypothetical protein
MIAAVLQNYGIDEKECSIQVFGSGLINTTWDSPAYQSYGF